jgi:hypothetical protein
MTTDGSLAGPVGSYKPDFKDTKIFEEHNTMVMGVISLPL